MTINLKVLELLSSRICHDLISPVSAINNGMELFEELGPDAGDEVTELISHSAKMSAKKLQMMRFAYGAGGNDPSIKPKEVFDAFLGLVEGERAIELTYPSPDRQMPLMDAPAVNRVLACVLFLVHECMPRGGKVELTCDTGKIGFSLEGVEQNLWDKAKPKMFLTELSDDEDELDPKTIHPYVTGIYLRSYGYNIDLSDLEDKTATISLAFEIAEESLSEAV